MSDASGGPGWWLASDGKWYPPAPTAPQGAPARAPGHYASERVVIQSPTSFTGSARRIWKMTDVDNPVVKILLVVVAVVVIAGAWILAAVWLMLWGIFLVPWRLIRRGGRKRKQDDLRHREMMSRLPPR